MASNIDIVLSVADPDEQVREAAIAELESMDAPEPDSLDRLVEWLTHESSDVGYWAATLLGRMEQKAGPAATALADVVCSEESPLLIRQRAAWALGKIGASNQQVTKALKLAAQNEDTRLARLATRALEKLS